MSTANLSNPMASPATHEALGQSDAFLELQERISRAAKTDRPIILIGERGTGKELAAARLHFLSARWGQPYVAINCASLPESLIESELFGHEAGAFTGAVRLRKGRFEMANGGTLFLDEIATLPLTVQEKILRVVEYGHMERVGSSGALRVDTRLVAATNADLRALAREGRFRQDLLDRLSFEVIVLPPLRTRKEDIMLLAVHFARKMAAELGAGAVPLFSPAARKALTEYSWPGNIRELKNVVERAVYRADTEVIDEIQFDPFAALDERENGTADTATARTPRKAEDLTAETQISAEKPDSEADSLASLSGLALTDAVYKLEETLIARALRQCRFNQRKAAERLGLTYDKFRGYLRRHKELQDEKGDN